MNFACISCGRSILPIGRVLWQGGIVCRHTDCEYTPMANVTSLFKTPYGSAVNASLMRIFCKTLEGNRVFVQISGVLSMSNALIEGYIDLVRWQRAYHDYDRLTHPDAYNRGAVSVIPPRTLADVLVFRSLAPPEPVDPTTVLEPDREDVAEAIRAVYRDGPTALEVPF